MKNNISFYSHDCDSDLHRKFRKLRGIIGWDAEGRFWALNNIIGHADGCLLDIDNEDIFDDVAHRLEMNYKDLKHLLRTYEICKLTFRISGKLTTDRAQETLTIVNKDREKDRNRKKSIPSGNSSNSVPETVRNPAGNTPKLPRNTPHFRAKRKEKEREKDARARGENSSNEKSLEASPPLPTPDEVKKFTSEIKKNLRRGKGVEPIENVLESTLDGITP